MPTLRIMVLLISVLPAEGRAPAPFVKQRVPRLPAGQWTVRFENGVVQTCDIGKDGSARTVEPLRTAAGKAVLKDGAVVIESKDDRIERWTMERGRLVVEHWFPASAYPAGAPVRGEARWGASTDPGRARP
ncbi:MAG: hypothetical protein K2W96_14470 [Gemmataceae bacterium]|nr:hypothetical protein [Gemmataceae bacterium]